jgi:cytochrome c peroxidase
MSGRFNAQVSPKRAFRLIVGLGILALCAHCANAAPSNERISALGEALFNDSTLSTPTGMSCATCHSASAGFTYPNSKVNLTLGTALGVVPGRFGNRAVPTIAYAVYLPVGPPVFVDSLSAYAGGLFWDGRANNLANQATFPFQNPNEMNNLVHKLGSPAMVVEKVSKGPSAALFKEYYGDDIFTKPTSQVFNLICSEIAVFETSDKVSPFTSKYDAWLEHKATLTEHEMNGLRLVTGSVSGRPGGKPYKFAQCALCHGIPADPKTGPDIFTNSCYANIGVPKNPNNPYYKMTSATADPAGYNPAGAAYIDLGLGGILYPRMGLPPGNMGKGSNGKGDFLAINGTFKAPTLRNIDKRPSPEFVKAYMHNGVFKNLYDVVHFYNTRNLTDLDEVIDFTKLHPYAGLKGIPLHATPEFPSPISLQNPNGATASSAAQVGNLGLTHEEENEIVDFLKTLSDGYFER